MKAKKRSYCGILYPKICCLLKYSPPRFENDIHRKRYIFYWFYLGSSALLNITISFSTSLGTKCILWSVYIILIWNKNPLDVERYIKPLSDEYIIYTFKLFLSLLNRIWNIRRYMETGVKSTVKSCGYIFIYVKCQIWCELIWVLFECEFLF